MIVNSSNDPSQMDSQNHQNENFYLKRKLTLDMLDSNQSYVQPKKRLIQNFSNNFVDQCNENFNLNGNMFTTNECNGIELINFDGVTLVPPIQTTTIYTTTAGSDNYDGSWSSPDLLELDQRYNSIVNLDTNCVDISKTPAVNTQKQPEVLNNTNTGQQMPNQEQNDMDFDDRNLSWLFNFKLDELPHLSPEVNRTSQLSPTSKLHQQNEEHLQQQLRTGRKVDELIMETTADLDESEMSIAENVVVENTPKMPKKPPFTYTELIEYALEDRGELTVSGIYQWIS
ncbi:unnamed protein product [Hermetia illucens]|nr:unnamed protein product [Hermetia illucens]